MFVDNVDWAIELTQCYGQSNQTLCNEYPSNLTISDVWFKDFTGVTSTSEEPDVATLVCSSPSVRLIVNLAVWIKIYVLMFYQVCSNIYANNINVTSPTGTNEVICQNVRLLPVQLSKVN
jgi:galacturan 1,4-alpha-galacturonidase